MKIISAFIALLFLTISLSSLISCNVTASEIEIDIKSNFYPMNNDEYTWVKFCCGKISNLWEIGSGYTTVGYGFNAENVVCIISFCDRPIIHHFNNGEKLAIDCWFYLGIIDDDFICAFRLF